MYYLTQKIGTKKFALAEWIGDKQSCLRLAESVFSHYGYKINNPGLQVEWKTSVENQKMYKGKSQEFKLFTDSLEQAEKYHDLEIINDFIRRGKTQEYILEIFPEFEKYFSQE